MYSMIDGLLWPPKMPAARRHPPPRLLLFVSARRRVTPHWDPPSPPLRPLQPPLLLFKGDKSKLLCAVEFLVV